MTDTLTRITHAPAMAKWVEACEAIIRNARRVADGVSDMQLQQVIMDNVDHLIAMRQNERLFDKGRLRRSHRLLDEAVTANMEMIGKIAKQRFGG